MTSAAATGPVTAVSGAASAAAATASPTRRAAAKERAGLAAVLMDPCAVWPVLASPAQPVRKIATVPGCAASTATRAKPG